MISKEERSVIKEKALELYSSGMSSQEVSDALDNKIAARTVRKYIFEAGISRKSGIDKSHLRISDHEQICYKCGILKSLDKFGINKLCANNHKGICYQCENKRHSKWYKKNKIQLIKLKGNKCQICGKQYGWWVYDFHHVDSSKKEVKMSQLYKVANMNLDKVFKELDKCMLVCANCHRDIHYRQEGGENAR